ncbi:MAG: leucine-rich repeat protein [Oscillospiraceae bacterium]|nr:leucine-rich repeat protein [Oscillospiraceae bacterium]
MEGICFPIGDVKPLKWTKTNVQGEVEVKLEFDIGVVFAKLVDLKFRGSITLDILAEVSLINKKHCMYGTPAAKSTMFMPFYETDEPSVHACDMGLDLKVDLTFKVGLVVSFGFKLPEKLETAALKNGLVKLFNLFGELKFEKELTLFDTTYHIGDYHVMSNKGGKYAGLNFVEQPCPNVAYRTTFNVQFTNITSASKAAIEVDGDMYEVPITPNTQLIFYATPGKHRYYLMVDSRQRAGAFFTVQNEPVTINIPITDSIDKNGEKHPEPSNPTILTGPAVPAVTTTATTPVTFQTATAPAVHPGYINTELIQFGDSIFGTLSHNGVLSISGCGDMFDHFTSSLVRNVKDVRLILLMDSDEEHGYVINTIGAHVFDGMENVEIVYLPQHITAIGDGAFRNCASLKYLRYGGEHDTSTTFILPTNLTKIGSEAFRGCKSAVFRELTFRPCIRTIGANAFGKCEGITELTVPGDSSPTIGRIAFSDCVNLRKAVIGDGTAGIGTELFSGCSGIEDLTMPYCGTSLTDTSKQLYEFFNYGYAPAGFYNVYHRQTPASSFYGSVPLSLTKFTVTGGTAVPGGFFENMKELKSVTLAESITEIRGRAFRLCEQLETVNLPKKLTTIGQDAFHSCKAAAFGDLHLPDTLHEIGAAAFAHCEGITGLTVSGDGTLTIGNSAFGSCVNLRKAVLGDGIETIAPHVFSGDADMEELTISRYLVKGTSETPVGISSYFNAGAQEGMYQVYCRSTPSNSFRGYVPEKLKKVTVTDAGGVPYGFFANMRTLESVTLPAASPAVAAYAFNGCEALAEANLTGEGSWDEVDITGTGNEPLLRVISQMRPVDYLLSNPLTPGDYFFRSKANNRYLDLAASSYTTLICYDFNAGRNQTFYYQDGEMKSEQNGKYVTMGESYYGGFKAVADEDSSVVEVYKKPGTENYYFTKSICDGNGDFKTYALEVKNPSASSSVVFWNELQVNNVNQQWSVESTSHEYGNSDVINIQNANSGLLLDMYTANGNLLQYAANGGDNQKWQVIPADNGRALLKTMCAAHPGYIGIGDDDRAVVGENEVPVKLFDNQDGTFRIYLPGTNKFLHVANDSMGNAIVKWEPYTGTGGFHWKYL